MNTIGKNAHNLGGGGGRKRPLCAWFTLSHSRIEQDPTTPMLILPPSTCAKSVLVTTRRTPSSEVYGLYANLQATCEYKCVCISILLFNCSTTSYVHCTLTCTQENTRNKISRSLQAYTRTALRRRSALKHEALHLLHRRTGFRYPYLMSVRLLEQQ